MTDKPRDRDEEAKRAQEEKDRRSDKLKESWRRNHSSAEGPDDGRGRPRKPGKGGTA